MLSRPPDSSLLSSRAILHLATAAHRYPLACAVDSPLAPACKSSAPCCASWWTVFCDTMLVPDVPEEPDFVLWCEHRYAECMYGCITKPFVVEPSCLVQILEVCGVGLGAEEIEVADFEVAEELAIIVLSCSRVQQPGQISLGMHKLRVFGDEVESRPKQAGEGSSILQNCHIEPIDNSELGEEEERVVWDGAEKVHVWLNTPVVVIVSEGGMFVEEAAVPSTHGTVREEVAFANADGPEIVEAVHVAVLIDP
jgi:hypothetical protein